MKKIFIALLFLPMITIAQNQILASFELKSGPSGVIEIPCKVYNLNWNFIFDTGASSVCISLKEANYLYRRGYINESNFVGMSKSQIASGEIIENMIIKLDYIEVAGKRLHDIEAVVVPTLNAPLLLGMNVISKLGQIKLEGNKLIIYGSDNDTNELNDMYEDPINN